MIVADSSFLARGLMTENELLNQENFLVPDIAVYEVANVAFKHQVLLKLVPDAFPFVQVMFDLSRLGKIVLIEPRLPLVADAFRLAVKNRTTLYDMIFVALALSTGLDLATLDLKQRSIFESERRVSRPKPI